MAEDRFRAGGACSSEAQRLYAWSRWALAFAVWVASSFAFRVAFQLPKYREEFSDLLRGESLPTLTLFVLMWHPVFLGVAIAVPAMALISAACIRSGPPGLALLAGLVVVAILEGHVLWSAVLEPYHLLATGLAR